MHRGSEIVKVGRVAAADIAMQADDRVFLGLGIEALTADISAGDIDRLDRRQPQGEESHLHHKECGANQNEPRQSSPIPGLPGHGND